MESAQRRAGAFASGRQSACTLFRGWETQAGAGSATDSPRSRQWYPGTKFVLILLATIAALYFRRPDQFFAPYIWVEDGTVSLPQFMAHGWAYLADPVAGYLILPSKLIQASALTLSAIHYPQWAMALTVLFHAGVLACIALSPTSLRAPLACALFTLLIPTDSEVFGTSHYAFWWGSLLLLPPLLWSPRANRRLAPRIGMVFLGGLSSPLVIALLPVFAVRLALNRTRQECAVASAALACAATQMYFLRTSGTHGTSVPADLDLLAVVAKFFGNFVFWTPGPDGSPLVLGLGLAVLAVASVATALSRKAIAWRHAAIFMALGVSILISISRMPVEHINPISAGPRYFFYPYIFLAWLLIELVAISQRPVATVLVLSLAIGLRQFALYAPRGHHAVDWAGELSRCAASPGKYNFPVHFAGNRGDMWHVELPGPECNRLVNASIFQPE